MRITPISIEYNTWNGLVIEILGIDWWKIDGDLIGINLSHKFLYVSIFFFSVKIFDFNKYTITMKIKEEAHNLKELPGCPFCEGINTVVLNKEQRTLTVKGIPIEGDYWIYTCSSCKEGFTTTESDTLSLKNFEQ